MKALLLCLILFFTSYHSLGAFEVPCAEAEMMKMKISYFVPQGATPEEAAQTIAERLSWPELLQPHPDAPDYIKSRFKEIKAMVIQIKEGKPISKVEPVPTVQIVYTSRTHDIQSTPLAPELLQPHPDAPDYIKSRFDDIKTMVILIKEGKPIPKREPVQTVQIVYAARTHDIQSNPLATEIAPMDNLHTPSNISLAMVDRPASVEEAIVYKNEPEDRQDCSFLSHNNWDVPGDFDGGGSDLQNVSGVTTLSNTIVAQVPAVEVIADPLPEDKIRGTRMPVILKDTALRTPHMVEENSNFITTKTSTILRIPAPSLEFMYVLFLLTILANFCGGYLSPRSLSFARIKR